VAADEAIRALGLYTDPNQHDLPPGALTEAISVVIDRTGVVEPRPGISQSFVSASFSPTAPSRRIAPFADDIIEGIEVGGTAQLNAERAGVSFAGDFHGAARPEAHPYEMCAARGQLLVTGSRGIVKIRDPASASSCYTAGISKAAPPFCALAAGTWFANGKVVAYRLCIRRDYSDGYTLRGSPSGAQWFRNDSGGTRQVTLSCPLTVDTAGVFGANIIAGDVLEVYRSAQEDYTTTSPSDDLQLVVEHIITSSEISAGTATITDDVTDTVRQANAFIYTAPSQEGIEGANETPPWCSDVQNANRLWFYGDVRLRMSWILGAYGADGYAWKGTYVKKTASGATITISGSPTNQITVTAGAVKVGQAITIDGQHPVTAATDFQPETIITADLGAGLWQISKNTTANDVGRVCTTWDVVQVGGRNYYASTATSSALREFAVGGAYVAAQAQEFCFVVNTDQSQPFWAHPLLAGLAAKNDDGVISIEFIERRLNTGRSTGESAVTLTVYESQTDTTKSVYTPHDAYGSTTARFIHQDLPGVLMVSKQDEPEAVPIANLVVVGDAQKRIYRCVPVREALWVFKEDGLFRVSGDDAASMVVDVIDPSVTLLHSYAADVLDDVVYAWTSQGIQTFGDGGSQNISATKIGYSLRNIEEALAAHPDNSFGQFVCCDTTAGRVLIGYPSSISASAAIYVYCFSTRTECWTRWDIKACAACYDPSIGRVVFDTYQPLITSEGAQNLRSFAQVKARDAADYGSDYNEAITITSSIPSGTTTWDVVYARPANILTPVAGDAVIIGGTTIYRVTAVSVSASDVTLTVVGNPGTGAAALAHSYATAVTWASWDGGAWQFGKRYRDVRLLYDTLINVDSMLMSYVGTDPPETNTSASFTMDTSGEVGTRKYLRVGVPRAVARATNLLFTTAITQAWSNWQLVGVAPGAVLGSERVRR
jgi:hypothetical protein